MRRYNYGDVVYLISTGHKAEIKSVITNHSTKITTYLLSNGMKVCEGSITSEEPVKSKPKKVRKKKSLQPMEQADQSTESQEFEKTDNSEENTKNN